MRTRAFVRAVPRSPMTVAFEDAGEPFAYGAVANISEGGACVWTAAHFDVGQQLSLRLSAARQPQPFETPAAVVWGMEDPAREPHTHRYGLRWVEPSSNQQDHIRRLLSS
jgi:Tfp pilus assembly protein PilZ